MSDTIATFPAEWAPQCAVILTWPHVNSDWAPRLTQVEPAFVQLTQAISTFQTVLLICQSEPHRQTVLAQLTAAGVNHANLRSYLIPSNDTWVRDYGPLTTVVNGTAQLLDFRFNGWGGKFAAELDDRVSRQLQEMGAFGKTAIHYSSIILEGGSIDTDGQGTLLTTERCLLGPTRNAHMNKTDYERVFKTQLGIDRVIWLAHGELLGDDTDGHVDMLARFCDPDTIAYMHCDDPDDPHHAPLAALHAELQAIRTKHDTPYRLIPLPLPVPIYDNEQRRLPASYANFLIINGAVLVPTYDDPSDTVALARLRQVFPQRQVIGIPFRPIIEQNGSLHCLTMQLPAGVIPASH